MGLSDEYFDKCKSQIGKSKRYLTKDMSGGRYVDEWKLVIPEKKFDMLIDIQEIIAQGKGPGYERWAKVHNIKQISQTLIYLRDHDIRDMDELAKRAGESSAKFTELSQIACELVSKQRCPIKFQINVKKDGFWGVLRR